MSSPYPEEVQLFVEQEDEKAINALASTDWWQEFKESEEWESSTDALPDLPIHKIPMEQIYFNTHLTRPLFPESFVLGYLSPFYVERVRNVNCTSMVWAVYLHFWAQNTGQVANGGALSALLDNGVSGCAFFHRKAYCVTKSLYIDYLRPVQPVPGVIRMEVDIIDENDKEMYIVATIFDEKERECVTAEAVLVEASTGKGLSKRNQERSKL